MAADESSRATQGEGDGQKGGHGSQGGQPNASGPPTQPSMPFSITITVEIKGYSNCPIEVKTGRSS